MVGIVLSRNALCFDFENKNLNSSDDMCPRFSLFFLWSRYAQLQHETEVSLSLSKQGKLVSSNPFTALADCLFSVDSVLMLWVSWLLLRSLLPAILEFRSGAEGFVETHVCKRKEVLDQVKCCLNAYLQINRSVPPATWSTTENYRLPKSKFTCVSALNQSCSSEIQLDFGFSVYMPNCHSFVELDS